MKRPPARPLCSVLLLTLLAVAITCRTVLRCGGSGSFELKSAAFLAGRPAALTPVSFDSSMLKRAEIDIAEEKFKKDIEQLLDGNFEGHGRHRTFSEWRTFSLRDPEARTSRSSTSTSMRSPQFYRYWLDFRRNLQHWARNKRFEPEVMNDLIRLVKHPLDKHRGLAPSDRRYASCAVVGNSGILLRGNHGTLIDRHEVVIRLNNARIEGFERDVGTKTTLSFINSNILHFCSRRDKCYCHPYGTDTPIAMYICQPVHFLDYTMCNSSHRSPLLVTDPRFDILCGRIVKYYSLKRFVTETGKALDAWDAPHDAANFHYSSGMQGVMLALGICDRVSMFGFGKSASAKHHYHTNQRAELSLHDYEAEYDLYRDLAERPQAIPLISDKFNFPPLVIYQ